MATKQWPFVESPGDFAMRLEAAYFAFDSDMLAAVRNCLIENTPMLASAPAPASGRVDAVARCLATGNPVGTDTWQVGHPCRCANCASLSPAATPVSEAEPDWMEAQQVRKRRGVEIMQEYAWGNLTPLGVANHLMRAGFNIDYAQKVANDLAKPASSPAPVRPIGNQGISDYQREIARNMAEGFAAWNAARQEALPSDEPASSPAGGDVVREALEKVRRWAESRCPCHNEEPNPCPLCGASVENLEACKSAENTLPRELLTTIRAALSQSTSAGRVGE